MAVSLSIGELNCNGEYPVYILPNRNIKTNRTVAYNQAKDKFCQWIKTLPLSGYAFSSHEPFPTNIAFIPTLRDVAIIKLAFDPSMFE